MRCRCGDLKAQGRQQLWSRLLCQAAATCPVLALPSRQTSCRSIPNPSPTTNRPPPPIQQPSTPTKPDTPQLQHTTTQNTTTQPKSTHHTPPHPNQTQPNPTPSHPTPTPQVADTAVVKPTGPPDVMTLAASKEFDKISYTLKGEDEVGRGAWGLGFRV